MGSLEGFKEPFLSSRVGKTGRSHEKIIKQTKAMFTSMGASHSSGLLTFILGKRPVGMSGIGQNCLKL